MKIKYLILIFSINFLWPVVTSAQDKTTNTWCFGWYAGIDFNSNSPTSMSTSSFAGEGCSSICDNNGNLLFYTSGVKVFDHLHNLMSNGNGLYGNISTTQSALIVPKPGSSTLYYIFTLDDASTHMGFNYSIVDMTLNGGLGDVIAKNTPLLINIPLAEKLAGTMHLNGRDVWIAVQGSLNDTCYMYKITPSGINTPSRIHTPSMLASWGGETKFSKDGTKFVSVENNLRTVQLMDFNNATGTFSNGAQITLPISRNPYGVEFSPNGTKLYITTSIDTSACLYQFDLTAGSNSNSLATGTMIYSVPTSYYGIVMGGLQAGPDNKVYISRANSRYIGAINFPEIAGIGCGIDDMSIYLGGDPHHCGYALPNNVTNYQPLTKVLFVNTCDSSYTLNGTTFNASGTYLQTLAGANINGEDSVIKLNLTINHAGSYALVMSSCDSLTLNGVTYTTDGTYIQHLSTVGGCDSTLTINLTITHPTSASLNISACDSLQINGTSYYSSGTYTQHILNSANCDSTLILNVNILNHQSKIITAATCDFYEYGGLFYWGSTVVYYTDSLGCQGTVTLNLINISALDTSITRHGDTLTANQTNVNYQWFNCSTNTGISGATGQSFTPTTPGNYALALSAGSCLDTSSCYVTSIATGLNELTKPQINANVFPNPFSNIITVTLSQVSDMYSYINIYNTLGQQIYNIKTNKLNLKINTDHLDAGLYTIRIMNGLNLITQRIIK